MMGRYQMKGFEVEFYKIVRRLVIESKDGPREDFKNTLYYSSICYSSPHIIETRPLYGSILLQILSVYHSIYVKHRIKI